MNEIKINENKYRTISDLVVILTPVKATVEALCRLGATLIAAEIALEFMLTKIKQQQSEIGKQLYAASSHRIKERNVFVPNTIPQNKKIITNQIKRLNSADIITSADLNSDVQLNKALSNKEIKRSKLLVNN